MTEAAEPGSSCRVDHVDLIERRFIIGQLDRPVYEEVQYEAQIDHLRHSRFVRLREDKNAKDVVRDSD